jgi:hypothetical protein
MDKLLWYVIKRATSLIDRRLQKQKKKIDIEVGELNVPQQRMYTLS